MAEHNMADDLVREHRKKASYYYGCTSVGDDKANAELFRRGDFHRDTADTITRLCAELAEAKGTIRSLADHGNAAQEALAAAERVIVAMREALDAVDRSWAPATVVRIPEIVAAALSLAPAALADMRLVPVEPTLQTVDRLAFRLYARESEFEPKGWLSEEQQDAYCDEGRAIYSAMIGEGERHG